MFVIATPGKPYGPCLSCAHEACLRQTEIAASSCYLCGQVIGYRIAFCCDLDGRPVHLDCATHEYRRQADAAGIERSSLVTVRPICFNKQEAAELLRIGIGTINDLISSDEISRTKIGTRVVFTPEQLTSFLKRCEIRCSVDRGLRVIK